jgi:ABC-2 type transport system ATP-binding protein
MRQKLGIVQAFQHDPELAILDEPTEGLDPLMQRSFYEVILDRQRAGRTIFFSSHILSEVERVCQRVAIVRHGALVALSDVAELLARRRRHVELRAVGTPPDLARVAGISDVHVDGNVVSCELEGDPGPLIAALHGIAIHDLLIEPARLEEAFMEYYADDESPSAPPLPASSDLDHGSPG